MRAALMALAVIAAVLVAARFVHPPDAVASGTGPVAAAPGEQVEKDPAASRAPGSTPTGAPAPTPAPSADVALQGADWWSVMAALDSRRSAALESGDPAGLADFAQPGSPAWLADEAIVEELAARGLHPEGLRAQVMAIERIEPMGSQIRLEVVDARSAYDLVDDEGQVMSRVEEAVHSRWVVVLAPAAPAAPAGAAAGSDADADPDAEAEAEARPGAEAQSAPEVQPDPEATPDSGGQADPDLGPDPGWRFVSVELLERGGATP